MSQTKWELEFCLKDNLIIDLDNQFQTFGSSGAQKYCEVMLIFGLASSDLICMSIGSNKFMSVS